MSRVPVSDICCAVCDSTMTQSSRKLVLIMGLVLFYPVLVLEVDPGGSSKIDKNSTHLSQARELWPQHLVFSSFYIIITLEFLKRLVTLEFGI